jgi:hypothetical protein
MAALKRAAEQESARAAAAAKAAAGKKAAEDKAAAAKAAAVARASFDGKINGEIRPHWRPPNGLDVEKLVARASIRLNRDGSLAGVSANIISGKTEDNAQQQARFVEAAIKAVRLAAPFNLPADYYDDWQTWSVDFSAVRGVR